MYMSCIGYSTTSSQTGKIPAPSITVMDSPQLHILTLYLTTSDTPIGNRNIGSIYIPPKHEDPTTWHIHTPY